MDLQLGTKYFPEYTMYVPKHKKPQNEGKDQHVDDKEETRREDKYQQKSWLFMT